MAERARIIMLPKNDTIDITRLNNIEKPATGCIGFKIKTQESSIVMSTLYQEWEHPESIKYLYTDGFDGEVPRVESFQKQTKKTKNISNNVLITGDINIDMLDSRDPISISRTCRTMPIYRQNLEDVGLCIMNKKPTWFKMIKRAQSTI